MISLTSENQVDLDQLLKSRNETHHVDHHHKAEIRKDIPEPEIDTKNCADGVWEKGNAEI